MNKNKGIIELHGSVLLFGFSGILGKIITFPVLIAAFGRFLCAASFLFIVLVLKKQPIKLQNKKDYCYFVVLGLLMAFVYVSFFMAIQLSTVPIGLLTYSSFPVFVTFINPLFSKNRLHFKDVIIALITFFGIILVVPHFNFESSMTQGALWGIASGLSLAVNTILSKKITNKYDGLLITFYQMFIATFLLLPFIFILKPVIDLKNVVLVVFLGVVFTGLSNVLFIKGLKSIRVQTVSIISCLEPVYGIIGSVIILREYLAMNELIGGIIILGAVIYATIGVGEGEALGKGSPDA
jgi:drug/metabolite transporter (DMT)-like permease